MSHLDLISDHSKEKLVVVPTNILEMTNLKMLFLEGNFITNLPEDIFWKLPRLMWLDLRNNLLESLPVSIAFHEKLENLLLTNNNLQRLPDELGTVQNLKALQVSDNPLVYPTRPVIVSGTKAIKNFLKAQYDKANARKESESEVSDKSTDSESSVDDLEKSEERVIQVTEQESTEKTIEKRTTYRKTTGRERGKSAIVHQIKKKISDGQLTNPDLQVKRLLSPERVKNKVDTSKVKILHKVSRTGSKLFLKSYFNKPINVGDNNKFNNLKEGWLKELKMLLADQERILQQERNLRAISQWKMKKNEYPKLNRGDIPLAPYDIDEKYIKIPSREDLAKQISELNEKVYVKGEPVMYSPISVQKMITDLMQQLKDIQTTYNPLSPCAEADQAEMQIRTIMDIQKKLTNLRSVNEKTLL